ncbi:MAG: hypothetical protein ACKV2T_11445 [Kofleriaceae bacterium]
MRGFAIVFALVASWSSVAYTQPAGAQAEVLFREGRELMQKQKYAEACTAFEQSQKLEPAPATLLNLAGCREKTNQLASAWGLFLEAERATRSASDATTKQLHDVAKNKAAKLEPRISKLTIKVAPGSDGVEVKRNTDRVDSAMWGRALPIDGGTYKITATAPGKTPWSTEITVGVEKDAKIVDVPVLEKVSSVPVATTTPPKPTTTPPKPTTTPPKPTTTSPPKPTTPKVTTTKPTETPTTTTAKPTPASPPATATTPLATTDDPRTSSRSKLPYIVGGGGVVLVGAAVGLGLWGRATYADAKAETSSQSRRNDLESSANTKLLAAQGVGIAGVAAIGVAVWLFVRGGDETPRTARVLSVTPNGVAIGGTF